jgi:hypothetical protein
MHWIDMLTGGAGGGGLVAGFGALLKRSVVSAVGGAVEKGVEPVKTKVNELAEDVAHVKGVVDGLRNPITGRHEAA